MESSLVRDVLAARVFDERANRSLGQVWVAEALENAGARPDAERARKRRERVARFLKALAYRLAPPTFNAGRTANSPTTVR